MVPEGNKHHQRDKVPIRRKAAPGKLCSLGVGTHDVAC